MENTIVIREPSNEAIRLAKRKVEEAGKETIQEIGPKQAEKSRKVLKEIEKAFPEKEDLKNEKTAQKSNDEISK